MSDEGSRFDYPSGTCAACPNDTFGGSPICEECSVREEANGLEWERDQLKGELQRYREREPLVQMLVRDAIDGESNTAVTARAVRDFKVTP